MLRLVNDYKVGQQVTIFGCELCFCPKVFELSGILFLVTFMTHLDASSRFSAGLKKIGLEDNRAATVSIGLKQ